MKSTSVAALLTLLALGMPLESTGTAKDQDPSNHHSSRNSNATQFKCDKKTVLLTRTSGTVRSPGHPRPYQPNQRCTWHISVPRGYQIKVRFRKNFNIEHSRGCGKDFIMLSQTKHFRNPMRFCGSTKPHNFFTPKNNLWIRFQSDNDSSGKGFSVIYFAVDENECDRQVCTFPSLCRNTVGSYACDCPEGFENRGNKDTARCVDTDECKSGIARCEQKCINTEGSYHCQCRKGYRLAPDGRRCRASANTCGRGNEGCSHYCEKVRSTARCRCPPGFVLHSDKKTCKPEISFNKSQYTASLSEAAPPGTVLVRVKASSYPLQQDIAYFLRSENLHLPTKFAVDTQTGLITLMRSLDREMTSDYFLEIEARYMVLNASGRAEYKSTKCYVVVHVQDHNDNAPFFPRSHYYVHVPCNASVGKTVYRARAQDRDDGPNGQLRYRLMSWHDYFGMSHGGKVKVTKDMRPFCTSSPLRSFILTVQARDSGSVPLSARAYIHVIVTPPGKLSRGPAVNEELWTAGANLQRDQAKSRRSKLPLPRRKQTR